MVSSLREQSSHDELNFAAGWTFSDTSCKSNPFCKHKNNLYGTDETYTDAELARVSVLILDVTKTAYVSPVAKRLASVMKNFNKKIDRKNLNFVNKTAI